MNRIKQISNRIIGNKLILYSENKNTFQFPTATFETLSNHHYVLSATVLGLIMFKEALSNLHTWWLTGNLAPGFS